MVPARKADAKNHLRNAKDDGDLHLQPVEHRDPEDEQQTNECSLQKGSTNFTFNSQISICAVHGKYVSYI